MAQTLGGSGGAHAQASGVWASHSGQWVSISTGGGTPAPSPLRLSDYAGTPIGPENQSTLGTWGSTSATWDGSTLVLDFRNASAGFLNTWNINIGIPYSEPEKNLHLMRDHPDRTTDRHTTGGWWEDDTGTTWTPAAPMLPGQGVYLDIYWNSGLSLEGEEYGAGYYMAGMEADGTPYPKGFGLGRAEYRWDPPYYQPAPSRPYNWFGYFRVGIMVIRNAATHPGGTIRIPKLEFGYHMNPDAPVIGEGLTRYRAVSIMGRGRDFAISWLTGRGVTLSPDALAQLTDEELLGLVVDLLDSERP